MPTVVNFNPGPAILPRAVLEEVSDEMLDFSGKGISILESSHRGDAYMTVHNEALANLRELLEVPDSHSILLLQGGATGQFAMLPLNLLGRAETADYVRTGAWSDRAISECERVGTVHLAADTTNARPARMPDSSELRLSGDAAYLHITSNETIQGTQYSEFPTVDAPLVADMSSDILSRPIDTGRFGVIYAGAQKNLGIAGVVVVIIRNDLLECRRDDCPDIYSYRKHADSNSLLHTPPCFAIYILALVTRWIKRTGRENIHEQNRRQASTLYSIIDASDFYRGTAAAGHRSNMNVTFRLPDESQEKAFLTAASAQGMIGLAGHRSVGGIRASIYNAMPSAGVDALAAFMKEFECLNG